MTKDDEDGVTFVDSTIINRNDADGNYSVDVIVNAPTPGTIETLAEDDFSTLYTGGTGVSGDTSSYAGGAGWADSEWVAYEDRPATTIDTNSNEGAVRVNDTNDVLEITDNGRAAQRAIDLSGTTGDITLNFDYQELDGNVGIDPTAHPLQIWLSNDNGASFSLVDEYTTAATSQTSIFLDLTTSLSTSRSANTVIRFRVKNADNLALDDGYTIDNVEVTETIPDTTLVGWIDFDRSGTFDSDEEQILSTSDSTPLSTDGTTVNTLTWSNITTSSLFNDTGETYARFRLSTDTLTETDATGQLPMGR